MNTADTPRLVRQRINNRNAARHGFGISSVNAKLMIVGFFFATQQAFAGKGFNLGDDLEMIFRGVNNHIHFSFFSALGVLRSMPWR